MSERLEGNVDYQKSFSDALSILQSEFQLESSKKENLENRAGMILTFISAFFMLSFQNIGFDFIQHNETGYSIQITLKIILQIAFWGSYFYTVITTLRVLLVKEYQNFLIDEHVKAIVNHSYRNQSHVEQTVLTQYCEILKHNRQINENKATLLQKAMISLIACFAFYFTVSII